jgi:hypothetical protein
MIIFFVALRSNVFYGVLLLEVSRSHATTHHRRLDAPGRVIRLTHRPLPDNTQLS